MSQKPLAELNACSKDDFVARARATSSNIRRGSPSRRASRGRLPACNAAVRRDEGGGRARAGRAAARADQGASRSRRQDPARRGPDRGIHRRAEQRRPRPAVGCGISRRSSASTTPIARNSAFPISSASAATPRIPSCAISSGGCRTTRRPKSKTSIAEICRIAALRLDQLVTADDRLPVHGRLSTHVLDTHGGKPAAGIAVELIELSDARRQPRRDAHGDQHRRPHRSAADRRPAGADRPLRAAFPRRRIFRRARRAAVGSAVPRRDPAALFGQRPEGPSPRAAAGDAVELCDVSRGKLIVLTHAAPTTPSPPHPLSAAALLPSPLKNAFSITATSAQSRMPDSSSGCRSCGRLRKKSARRAGSCRSRPRSRPRTG